MMKWWWTETNSDRPRHDFAAYNPLLRSLLSKSHSYDYRTTDPYTVFVCALYFFQSISIGSEWKKKSCEFDLENPGSNDTAGNTISSSDTVDVRGTPPGGRKSKSVFTVGKHNNIRWYYLYILRYVIFCSCINTILTLLIRSWDGGGGIRPITFQEVCVYLSLRVKWPANMYVCRVERQR